MPEFLLCSSSMLVNMMDRHTLTGCCHCPVLPPSAGRSASALHPKVCGRIGPAHSAATASTPFFAKRWSPCTLQRLATTDNSTSSLQVTAMLAAVLFVPQHQGITASYQGAGLRIRMQALSAESFERLLAGHSDTSSGCDCGAAGSMWLEGMTATLCWF